MACGTQVVVDLYSECSIPKGVCWASAALNTAVPGCCALHCGHCLAASYHATCPVWPACGSLACCHQIARSCMSGTPTCQTTLWIPPRFGTLMCAWRLRQRTRQVHSALSSTRGGLHVGRVKHRRSWWGLVFDASGVSQQLCTAVAVSAVSYLLQQQVRTCDIPTHYTQYGEP